MHYSYTVNVPVILCDKIMLSFRFNMFHLNKRLDHSTTSLLLLLTSDKRCTACIRDNVYPSCAKEVQATDYCCK